MADRCISFRKFLQQGKQRLTTDDYNLFMSEMSSKVYNGV